MYAFFLASYSLIKPTLTFEDRTRTKHAVITDISIISEKYK